MEVTWLTDVPALSLGSVDILCQQPWQLDRQAYTTLGRHASVSIPCAWQTLLVQHTWLAALLGTAGKQCCLLSQHASMPQLCRQSLSKLSLCFHVRDGISGAELACILWEGRPHSYRTARGSGAT